MVLWTIFPHVLRKNVFEPYNFWNILVPSGCHKLYSVLNRCCEIEGTYWCRLHHKHSQTQMNGLWAKCFRKWSQSMNL